MMPELNVSFKTGRTILKDRNDEVSPWHEAFVKKFDKK
jgi:hypothetical protein